MSWCTRGSRGRGRYPGPALDDVELVCTVDHTRVPPQLARDVAGGGQEVAGVEAALRGQVRVVAPHRQLLLSEVVRVIVTNSAEYIAKDQLFQDLTYLDKYYL